MTQHPPFDVRTSFTADAVVVSVTGEVDMATAPRVEEAVAVAAAAPDQTPRVVVDLTAVTFLDSTGINALVRAQRLLGERDIALRLVAPEAGLVRRLFEIANLLEPLHVVESRDEALS